MNPIGFIISYASLLRQKSGKPLVSQTRGRVHMEHIRPTHASMHVRLYSMLTFAFANIISYFFHIHSLHFCYPSATIPFISSRKDVDLSTSLRYNPKY